MERKKPQWDVTLKQQYNSRSCDVYVYEYFIQKLAHALYLLSVSKGK